MVEFDMHLRVDKEHGKICASIHNTPKEFFNSLKKVGGVYEKAKKTEWITFNAGLTLTELIFFKE